MSSVTLLFICLSICFSSVLNIAYSDSLVDKLPSLSDWNDRLVLDDKVCEPSTSSYSINLSNNLYNSTCIVCLWYGEIILIIIMIIIIIISFLISKFEIIICWYREKVLKNWLNVYNFEKWKVEFCIIRKS